MTIQRIIGNGPLLPVLPNWNLGNWNFNSSLVIDATGEKIAFIGRVCTPNRGSKDIRRVQFRWGNITKAGGSALTISLQDVDLATGPPSQPDGTQDQTVAVANADSGFASSTWYRSGTFSADRTVAHGDLLAVVIEYDGSGRLSSDSVVVNTASAATFNDAENFPSLYTASWAAQNAANGVMLEFSDGTFGWLTEPGFASNLTNSTYNSGSTPDERGLQFTLTAPMEIDGLWACVDIDNAADLCLYDGTTLLASVSLDPNVRRSTNTGPYVVPISPLLLTPAGTYHVTIKPTTGSSVTILRFVLNAASHMDCFYGGQAWGTSNRTDAGAFGAIDSTERPLMGVRLSGFEHGVSPTFALGI